MITDNKITKLFCMADDFCKFFDAIMAKYTLKPIMKHKYNLNSKNIVQVKHSRHRSFDNFIVNPWGAITAYCYFPKKPCINMMRTIDT